MVDGPTLAPVAVDPDRLGFEHEQVVLVVQRGVDDAAFDVREAFLDQRRGDGLRGSRRQTELVELVDASGAVADVDDFGGEVRACAPYDPGAITLRLD